MSAASDRPYIHEPVERAARTLFEADRLPDDETWDELMPADADSYRKVAAKQLAQIAQWIEDDAADADEPVREYAAAIAARIRGLTDHREALLRARAIERAKPTPGSTE